MLELLIFSFLAGLLGSIVGALAVIVFAVIALESALPAAAAEAQPRPEWGESSPLVGLDTIVEGPPLRADGHAALFPSPEGSEGLRQRPARRCSLCEKIARVVRGAR